MPPRSADAPLVFRWDLDKTYLQSEFETLRELVRIPFEKAEDKVAAPGVAALIRGVRETALSRGRSIRVYFVSASPPQIGRAIRRKLELDGIVYDGIVFKNQLQRLMRGKFRHLREQVGYKVTELLAARATEPPAAREYLFGDDWESDPLIYSLYADIVAGRVDATDLGAVLRAVRVDPPLIERSCALAAALTPAEAVARIFINLERPTPPAQLRAYGPRLVPTFNYLQTAACLYADEVLSAAGVVQVARSLIEDSAYTPERLSNSLSDAERRGHLASAAAAALRDALRSAALLPPAAQPTLAERWRRWRVGAVRAGCAGAGCDRLSHHGRTRDLCRRGERMTEVLIVFVTVPGRADGERIAEALVGEQLAACVNVIGPIRSIYRWQDEICRDDEHLLLIKTTGALYGALEARVLALHSYDTPEVVAVPIERGSAAYLEWVKSVTGDQ